MNGTKKQTGTRRKRGARQTFNMGRMAVSGVSGVSEVSEVSETGEASARWIVAD